MPADATITRIHLYRDYCECFTQCFRTKHCVCVRDARMQVQRGFMPERTTTDAIFIARQVMEKYREKRKPCYLAFADLEKAYDRLPRAVL
ncbi:unnamed protein product [Heligmosomoides polygyrus]|uniref:Reverse transcriptase domain-containing protein n=1 Tax=Heligmosomoides polygyrus TaxID=6339 RepID=A0A183FJ89_HELPZ|nr:unnamed protein product [Heligmosomoides polygyrus]